MALENERLYPVRKLVYLTDEMAERIRDHRFAHRLASENEAIRQLIEVGLSAAQSPIPTSGRRQAALSMLGELIEELSAGEVSNA